MTKQEIRVVTGSFCHFGACDKRGPKGRIRFSDVRFLAINDARTRTRFDIEYDGARARCRQLSDPLAPFVCSISDVAGPTYELALERGCMTGAVAVAGEPAWTIQTDIVEIAGHRVPGREVSLVDDTGVLAIADARASDNLDLFTRPGAPLSNAQLLMVIGVHAFLSIDHAPVACRSRS
jgi:hypothetical protein